MGVRMAASDFTTLTVRVTPNARRSEFAGWTMDEKGRPVLLIKLQAPPVDGKANTELLRFLADELECAKSQVTLQRGESSRLKVVELPVAAMALLPVRK
jgi:uncharacterized protein (TIGR00251 family)